jgi:Dyp-type peroxidase family
MTVVERSQDIPLREAPAAAPLRQISDQAHPNVASSAFPEPHLEIEQIQGNILPGFLKDHEMLLFLKIEQVAACKTWLGSLTPLIATAEEVLAFNRLFKALRVRRGRDTKAIQATWVNIAFSHQALVTLTAGTPNDIKQKDFNDQSFKNGMVKQAQVLGDPTDVKAEGNPNNWVIGGPQNGADIILIVQSDDRDDMLDQVAEIEQSLHDVQVSGVSLLRKEEGSILPGALAGHEHFGFLDGVSQPGIRGYVSTDSTDVLTPRQNPLNPHQGKPGQTLLWPGEFVFGYQGQDVSKPVEEPGDVVNAGPDWARNGSFLVFRRLRQDVGAFHAFLHKTAQDLSISPSLLAAKVVGRWQSGAPLLRSGEVDTPELGQSDCANNNFQYFHADATSTPPDIGATPGSDGQCSSSGQTFPPSPGDQKGLLCPAFAHIRKTYPRDDITPAASGTDPEQQSKTSEAETQKHRLLRRGLPFGEPSSSTIEQPISDDGERGLLFVSYQTSIENQFEFVSQSWANDPDFKDSGTGFDLVIGQNGSGARERTAKLILDGNQSHTLTAKDEWVIPTGGGYFFAPSISALHMLCGNVNKS